MVLAFVVALVKWWMVLIWLTVTGQEEERDVKSKNARDSEEEEEERQS